MAVTYGFYNALNHDRLYDAIQMSSIFDGIIRDGIFSTIGDTMIVTAPEDGMYVNVGSGRAWFNHTWTLNDTAYPIEAEQAEVVLDRIDAVILEVNSSAEVRANSIKFLKGTPSSNPVKPTLTHNAEVNQYALAYVRIRAGQTTIFQSDIENAVGTDETPFITGALQQVSIETLLKQWEAEFNTYFTNFKDTSTTEFNNWFAAKVSEYTAWFAQMQTDMDSNFNEFDAWFQNLKNQLDENQAGHLQLQIDALNSDLSGHIDDISDRGFYSKNLLVYPYKNTNATNNGVTFKANMDGTVTINGTATDISEMYLALPLRLKKGTYIASNGHPICIMQVYLYDTPYTVLASVTNNEVTFTLTQDTDVTVRLSIPGGNTLSNDITYPMIRSASVSDSTYEKYIPSNSTLSDEKANKDILSDAWNASTIYAVGQYCVYNNSLWKCLVQHSGQTPSEGTYWTKVSVANEITLVNNSFVSNIYVGSDGKLHKVQGGADSVLPFSSNKRYSYSWTSSNNEQKTLTLEIEPKYIAFTVGGNKQNATLYDVENQEYIINTTGTNIIASVNGKVVTINTFHGSSAVNYLNYW